MTKELKCKPMTFGHRWHQDNYFDKPIRFTLPIIFSGILSCLDQLIRFIPTGLFLSSLK